MRYKTLRQKGQTLKEAKEKLEKRVNLHKKIGWQRNGKLSVNWINDHYKGRTTFELSQEMFKI